MFKEAFVLQIKNQKSIYKFLMIFLKNLKKSAKIS